jgi:hypothetical protein
VAVKIREFLMQDVDSVESVSLRTMLNFNRIFEQQMLREIKSPYANPVLKIGGVSLGKTFYESIKSFIDTLPPTKRVAIEKLDIENMATVQMPLDEFINEFERIHKTSPKAGQAKK